MCKLSIITVNFNNLEGLKRTIYSVINQTCKDFEYIIIDGGSTDGSKEFIESHSNQIDYWVSEADKGIYNAMNKGIQVAKGEYLLFLNSGDHFCEPTSLLNNIDQIKNQDIIYFNVELDNGNSRRLVTYPQTLRFSFFYRGTLCHQSTLIKKSLFLKLGLYDEELRIASDWKFFILALFVHGCTYRKVDKAITIFYLDGISSKGKFSKEREGVLKHYFSGFVSDYEEWRTNRELLELNRFKMLHEIEKSALGRKMMSFFLSIYVSLFSKRKRKEILKDNVKD